MTTDRLREIIQRAYELHVLAAEEMGVKPLPPLPVAPAPAAMTPRLHRVMALVAQGLDNRTIAQELGVTEKTVRNAITDAYACLGVQNRVLAALVYRRLCEGAG